MRTNTGEVVYLGMQKGKLTNEDLNNLEPLLESVSLLYNELLSINNHFEMEGDAIVMPYITKKNNTTLAINFWLGASEPKGNIRYIGMNSPEIKHKLTIDAHSWRAFKAFHILNAKTALKIMINEYKVIRDELNEIFPENSLLRFMLCTNNNFEQSYVYSHYVPLNRITNSRDKLIEDNNRYILEYSGTYYAYYYSIDKSKYDSAENITEKDLIALD